MDKHQDIRRVLDENGNIEKHFFGISTAALVYPQAFLAMGYPGELNLPSGESQTANIIVPLPRQAHATARTFSTAIPNEMFFGPFTVRTLMRTE